MRLVFCATVLASFLGYISAALPADAAYQDGTAMSAACDDPIEHRPEGGKCVSTVNARVVDDTGAPLPDLLISVCAGTCFYGKTGDDGTFSVRIGSHLPVDQYATQVHGRPDYATYYAPLPPSSGDTYTYGAPLVLPRLPATGPPIATDGSAQTIPTGDATLHLGAGTSVDIYIEDRILGPIGSQLRSVRIADPTSMPFIDPASPPDLLYGFAPFETRFSQKTAISFANTSQLPGGTAIEVQSMHGLVGGNPPAGRFSPTARAHVSADGTRIDMDPGEGVLGLTWLALRAK